MSQCGASLESEQRDPGLVAPAAKADRASAQARFAEGTVVCAVMLALMRFRGNDDLKTLN